MDFLILIGLTSIVSDIYSSKACLYLVVCLILDDLFQNKNVTFILKNEEQIKVQSKAIQNNFDIETSQGIIKFDDIYQII